MKNGFSLIEILVGVALFAVLGTVSSVMLLSTMRGARKAEVINIAKNEGQFALNSITQMARFAKAATCGSTISLTLTKTDDTDVSYDLVTVTGRGTIASGSADLTSQKMNVTECAGGMFTCNGRNVRICFNIDAAGASDVTESAGTVGTGIKFVTTVVLRNYGI